MPILIGTSTKNQKAIPIGETQINRVYVGDKLVWQKPGGFTGIKYGALYNWHAVARPQTVEYGYLYNWYAATDGRNIAANGWHLPSDAEFNTLHTYLSSNQGGKLKETGTTYWNSPNTGATNEVGFNARGGGYRNPSTGVFGGIKLSSWFWTITNYNNPYAFNWVLESNQSVFGHTAANYNWGYSARLIKDSTTLTHGQTGTYTGNDGRIYQTICIGTQEWLSENLMETKYRNGDAIPEVADNTAWAALTTGARCAYNNTITNVGFGNAITSSDDWVVLTYPQLESLQTYLGGSTVAGGKLKETGTAYWTTPNTGSTNEVNFNARGAGWRNATGSYQYLNERNYILSTTYAFDSGGLQLHKYFLLKYDSDDIFDGSSFGINPLAGISIRLIYTGSGTPTSYTGNDGKIYRVVTINGVTYLAENLAETKFRNGDWITGYDGGTYTPISNAVWAAKTTEAMCIYGDVESNMLL